MYCRQVQAITQIKKIPIWSYLNNTENIFLFTFRAFVPLIKAFLHSYNLCHHVFICICCESWLWITSNDSDQHYPVLGRIFFNEVAKVQRNFICSSLLKQNSLNKKLSFYHSFRKFFIAINTLESGCCQEMVSTVYSPVNHNLLFYQITLYKEFWILATKNVCIHGGICNARIGTFIWIWMWPSRGRSFVHFCDRQKGCLCFTW